MENWIYYQEASQTAVSATFRGWMETNLFYLMRLAQENKVTIMKLPPHTTHVLQPLHVAVGLLKSLKTNWDKALSKWQRKNPRKRIPKQIFVHLQTQRAQGMLMK